MVRLAGRVALWILGVTVGLLVLTVVLVVGLMEDGVVVLSISLAMLGTAVWAAWRDPLGLAWDAQKSPASNQR